MQLFRAFVSLISFEGLDIDDALRVLLFHFMLPGESQQIDRVIISFTEEYCRQNPQRLCLNSSYLLAYSLIMLQTDAHNPNVLNKMTIDTFGGMVKFIKVHERDSLDKAYISKLYHSVTEYPLSVHLKTKKRGEKYSAVTQGRAEAG